MEWASASANRPLHERAALALLLDGEGMWPGDVLTSTKIEGALSATGVQGTPERVEDVLRLLRDDEQRTRLNEIADQLGASASAADITWQHAVSELYEASARGGPEPSPTWIDRIRKLRRAKPIDYLDE